MFKKGTSGNKGGRPKGSFTKPRLSDFLTKKQVDVLVKKATQMAKGGDVVMLKFVLEQHFGKAMQPMEGNIFGELTITFDNAFLNAPTLKTKRISK